MRVVVTGASGFIGWHLVDAMARRGDTVQAWTHGPNGGRWSGPVDYGAAVDITDSVPFRSTSRPLRRNSSSTWRRKACLDFRGGSRHSLIRSMSSA